MGHGEHAGAARRRRERRLRQFLRHERLTVAMVLSEKKHHTSKSQRLDRTRGEEYETHLTAEFRTTPPPQAAGTQYFTLDDVPGEVLAATRPASLAEPLPQPRLVRHTAQEAEFMPPVPILDSPVPLGGRGGAA